jgi:AraC-like DNA-binding protein
MFHVQSFRPDPLLREFIERYVYIGTGFHEEFIHTSILPHVHQHISFNLAADGLVYDQRNGEFIARHIVIGPADTVSKLRIYRGMRRMVVILKPGAWYRLFGISARPFLNCSRSVEEVVGKEMTGLISCLEESRSKLEQLQRANEFFLACQRHNPRHRTNNIEAALRQIYDSRGTISIKELVRCAFITSRTLERHFLEQTGMHPKMFARIVRFSETLKHLEGTSRKEWAMLADRQGYYDQSHFINEFQFFAGCAPSRYLKDGTGVRPAIYS